MKLTTFIFAFCFAAALCAPVRAQDQAPDAQQDQMQQLRMQIMQNMAAKGINPAEFFQDIRQKIQDGTMDPADVQNTLMEKGIIDQKMMTQVQTSIQSTALNSIRKQLV